MSWGKPAERRGSASGLSKETQSLLDGLISNRNLSKRAAEDVLVGVARGDNSWVTTLNSGVSRQRPGSHLSRGNTPKVAVPRVGNAARQAPPSLPGSFSGKRMQADIKRTTPSDREQYRSRPPAPDREREKDRLARRFELGREAAEVVEAKELEIDARLRRGEPAKPAAPTGKQREEPPSEQLIDQILDEIEERRLFLEAMRSKGQGQRYEAQIKAEIAGRLAELRRMGVAT